MNEYDAIRLMSRPGRHKPVWCGGVIQIWTTRACDKACFGCTQGSNLGGKLEFISLEHFEEACINLADYHGVVGVFGGNCTLHPKFPELCAILSKHIPKYRRGLWSNKLFGHGLLCRETFNPQYSNINVHLDEEAALEFQRDWPEAYVKGRHEDSRHGPPFVALQDIIDMSDDEKWTRIASCDVNREWSAIYAVFRGQLRFWFCELAGAQAILHQYEDSYPETGLPVTPRVWDRPMSDYFDQMKYHCMACGIPLKGYGELATNSEGTEQYSKTHESILKSKRRDRLVQLVSTRVEAQVDGIPRSIDYVENSHINKWK